MRVAVTVLLTFLLTACSGSGEPSTSAGSPAASTTSTAPSPTTTDTGEAQPTELLTLRETCPMLEASAPKGLNPPRVAWARFLEYIWDLRGTVDVETQNVLDRSRRTSCRAPHRPTAARSSSTRPAGATEAFSTLGRRCRAVSSSAFS
ncbi:MAG: hypothetical protein CMH83_05725 [Nocardioides sp.]|nr:hypothetical protein [Nocardioides sp.]